MFVLNAFAKKPFLNAKFLTFCQCIPTPGSALARLCVHVFTGSFEDSLLAVLKSNVLVQIISCRGSLYYLTFRLL